MPWILLVVAGLLEIVWATALKHTEGFTRFWPSALALSMATLSFVLLSAAMKQLPIGTAYAVWVGIGAVGVAIAGIVTLGEAMSWQRMGFLALIIAGIIGLKAVES
ncbi:multidrug efflux SMR transporter [Micromonospora sp. NPDC049230]|uniref:DMT family transporter n=1 Tax=Micromonospora sp. NPDC049230 TaxID=3155502 RepID=UPI0033CEDF21